MKMWNRLPWLVWLRLHIRWALMRWCAMMGPGTSVIAVLVAAVWLSRSGVHETVSPQVS